MCLEHPLSRYQVVIVELFSCGNIKLSFWYPYLHGSYFVSTLENPNLLDFGSHMHRIMIAYFNLMTNLITYKTSNMMHACVYVDSSSIWTYVGS